MVDLERIYAPDTASDFAETVFGTSFAMYSKRTSGSGRVPHSTVRIALL